MVPSLSIALTKRQEEAKVNAVWIAHRPRDSSDPRSGILRNQKLSCVLIYSNPPGSVEARKSSISISKAVGGEITKTKVAACDERYFPVLVNHENASVLIVRDVDSIKNVCCCEEKERNGAGVGEMVLRVVCCVVWI